MQRSLSHGQDDTKVVVAQTPMLTIEACSCGVFHLHFGALSMRFTEKSLEQVRQSIEEALLRASAPEARAVNMLATGSVRGQA